MSLDDCLAKTSHRQYMSWMSYLDKEWDKPSRSDHYCMQITREIRQFQQGFSKSKKQYKLNDFAIEFHEKNKPKPNRQKLAEWAKSRWFALTGYKGRK